MALVPFLSMAAPRNPSVAYIQRTMQALESSTAEKPATVRMLFYGQSIVAQNWCTNIVNNLQKRYPTAKLVWENRAIKGFQSCNLVHAAEADLYPFYPDILFFHVYGPLEDYARIIHNVRARTTAEIVLWSSHVTGRNVDYLERMANEGQRTKGIRAIAEENDCLFIDVERKWLERLMIEGKDTMDILSDGTHMKPSMTWWMSDLIIPELVRVRGLSPDSEKIGSIGVKPWTEAKSQTDGSFVLKFRGNRIVAISDGTGDSTASATFLLDGKPLAEHKALWTTTRVDGPNKPHDVQPPISEIKITRTPVAEEWSLTILSDTPTNALPIHYSVCGSVTGEDGEGWTDRTFLSRSGRCMITPDCCPMVWQYNWLRRWAPKPGTVFKWKTVPLFAECYRPIPAGSETLVLQGCANCTHELTIVPKGGKLGISGFRIYSPATVRSWENSWTDDVSHP